MMDEKPIIWPVDTDVTLPPGHPDAAPAPVPRIPGVRYGLGTDGRLVPEYEQPSPAPVSVPSVRRDVWPLRLASGGGAGAAVIGALGLAGPRLGEVGHAVQMAGIGVGAGAAGLGALVLLVKGSMSRPARQDVSVNVSVAPQMTVNQRNSWRRR